MWINRDLLRLLQPYQGLETCAVLGARQVGKSTLIQFIGGSLLSLDDLQLRNRAKQDPALALLDRPYPILVDEFQYAPELLSEIKLRIDSYRQGVVRGNEELPLPLFFLSGSNQIEVDRSLRETLAGRISLFRLHGLSVHEILAHAPDTTVSKILWQGGFPQLYTSPKIRVIDYITDYISTFVEKDIARSAGIEKLDEFLKVLQLLAARVAELVNFSSLGNDAGVAAKTVTEWTQVLERAAIVELLPVYSSNLNNRLIKTPKVFFLDSGLLVRLQGHLSETTILATAQAGHLFENLVLSEAAKLRDHFKLPITLSYWRTKEGEEVDLILESSTEILFVEVKLAIQNVTPLVIPNSARKLFLGRELKSVVITPGGSRQRLSDSCEQIPIQEFTEYARELFSSEVI